MKGVIIAASTGQINWLLNKVERMLMNKMKVVTNYLIAIVIRTWHVTELPNQ